MVNYHPHKSDNDNFVIIKTPSNASREQTWDDPNMVATFIPGSKVPNHFHNKIVSIETRTIREPKFHDDPLKVTAAGVIAIDKHDRIVLVSPTNQFGGYRFTFPKGTRDGDESLLNTARRETHEETGLHVVPTHYLGDYERSTSKARMYVGNIVGGSPANMCWENQAVHFVPVAQAHNFLHTEIDHKILKHLKNHLSKQSAINSIKGVFGLNNQSIV